MCSVSLKEQVAHCRLPLYGHKLSVPQAGKYNPLDRQTSRLGFERATSWTQRQDVTATPRGSPPNMAIEIYWA